MSAKQHPYQVALHSSLRDPLHRDSSCILGIFYAIGSISNAGGQTDFRKPYFRRGAMDFICGAASEDEHLARRQRLMVCQCNLGSSLLDIHRNIRAQLTPAKSLDLTLMSLCSNISTVLYTMTPGKFRKPKEGVHPDYQPWPSSLADILPHGKAASEILATLILWAAEPGHGQAIFNLITALTHFWEPFAVELFRTPSVFLLATELLDHAVDTFPGGVVPSSDVWVMNVDSIAGFLTRVSLVDGRGFMHVITPLLERMNSIAARMSPIWEEPLNAIVMEETRMWFTQSRRLATPRTTLHECLLTGDVVLEDYGPEPLTQYEEMYLSAFAGIWEARNRNRCMHLGCTNSIVSRSAVCARCGVIRYCTRECQKAAWKGVPLVPHKPLCDQICQLRVGLDMTHASSWDALILDSKFARSAVELLDVCRPHAAGIDISLVSAIRIGLAILSSEKVTKDDSIALSDA
ncbi:hypothetical protein C8J57DRAFT_1319263 [Mycena rebaudengoi]|nr:hypothetical protein C8J57DRAFT_1319263 [Mycena rebaudengoi]